MIAVVLMEEKPGLRNLLMYIVAALLDGSECARRTRAAGKDEEEEEQEAVMIPINNGQ